MARLNSDPVFSALTRPQMLGGVTYGYAVFNLIVTLELFLLTRSFWSFAVAGVLHVIGYLGCLRDPRFFDIWGVKLRHCPRVKNHWFWRMNSRMLPWDTSWTRSMPSTIACRFPMKPCSPAWI